MVDQIEGKIWNWRRDSFGLNNDFSLSRKLILFILSCGSLLLGLGITRITQFCQTFKPTLIFWGNKWRKTRLNKFFPLVGYCSMLSFWCCRFWTFSFTLHLQGGIQLHSTFCDHRCYNYQIWIYIKHVITGKGNSPILIWFLKGPVLIGGGVMVIIFSFEVHLWTMQN